MVIQRSNSEKIFEIFNITFMVTLMIVTIYPFLHILFASLSSPHLLDGHMGVLLRPLGFDLSAYKAVLHNRMISIGYKNTLSYVLAGTFLNIMMTSLAAYVGSRKNVPGIRPLIFMIILTMYFGGGLIPTYLVIQEINLLNKWWVIILPTAMSAYNFLIMRTSFREIPESLEESAKIDGANDLTILFRIVLPLSKPIISVMVLFYGVAHWNRWFDALVYLPRRRDLYPLQLVLREIVIQNQLDETLLNSGTEREEIAETIKYAVIMAATIPILFIYPFLQKYFTKGVMIGAIKQ